MDVAFDSEEPFNLFTGNIKGKPKYSDSVLKQYRKVVTYIRKAPNLNELKKITGLNIKKLKGEDRSSMKVSKQYRLEFVYEQETIVILKLSKHYEK
ncbi:MAG: hypothetical protein FVQ77_09530 [Cytophagales bacterium]|nr:hypothetical protein [Cytophagales bacterium]